MRNTYSLKLIAAVATAAFYLSHRLRACSFPVFAGAVNDGLSKNAVQPAGSKDSHGGKEVIHETGPLEEETSAQGEAAVSRVTREGKPRLPQVSTRYGRTLPSRNLSLRRPGRSSGFLLAATLVAGAVFMLWRLASLLRRCLAQTGALNSLAGSIPRSLSSSGEKADGPEETEVPSECLELDAVLARALEEDDVQQPSDEDSEKDQPDKGHGGRRPTDENGQPWPTPPPPPPGNFPPGTISTGPRILAETKHRRRRSRGAKRRGTAGSGQPPVQPLPVVYEGPPPVPPPPPPGNFPPGTISTGPRWIPGPFEGTGRRARRRAKREAEKAAQDSAHNE